MGAMLRDAAVGAPVSWTLVVPLKPLISAKSRLSAAADDRLRPALALAFALDTVSAALGCEEVSDVIVVTDDPLATRELASLGAVVVPDSPRRGLNAALAHGADVVRARSPRVALATLNADLPALRPIELGQVLNSAAQAPRSFLADAAGSGTTLLSALPDVPLKPAFGVGSRKAHLASGAREIDLSDVPSVRHDVDTGEDLVAALALGVGPHTLRTSGASPR